MKFLSIDFGLSFFGLAYSEGELAEPLFQFKIKSFPQTLKKIKNICQIKDINCIILGLPQGKLRPAVINFGRRLEKTTALPVILQPEDYSTREAQKKMIVAKKSLIKRQEKEHSFAACLILQDYLDQCQNN